MCGFIGIIRNQPKVLNERQDMIMKSDLIAHRGPDDAGYWEDPYASFAFRRLSIIDLEQGQQPFSYQSNRYWMVYNGEIYNYVELKKLLVTQGYSFETSSDTEVVIAMFDYYREEAFSYFRGMFALLIWDKHEETMYGARDPFGIKPLYYRENSHGVQFASEKKSLTLFENETVNLESLNHYLSFQYVPEPLSMSADIYKVEPGSFFVKKRNKQLTFTRYWKAEFKPIQREKSEWVNRIQNVLVDSVNVHMRSDVPVGSFLSGGIDSSLIVSIAKQFNPSIKTFSVGFQREGYSEVDVAKETAEKLDVPHFQYVITPEEYIKELPNIIWYMDDPLADPACVPLYFVAKEAKNHVKVVLSGEGADELFGGYNIYREPHDLRIFNKLPKIFLYLLKKLAQIIPEGVKGKSFLERGTTPLRKRYIGNAKIFDMKEKYNILANTDGINSYDHITDPLYQAVVDADSVHQMQYVDIHTWLRGDILLKADRMTMANSLELRVPFLDKEVFQVAREIPVDQKIANGTTKSILREAARGIVPDHVLDRKKLGFPVPIRYWLKNELHDWAVGLILESPTEHLINKNYVLHLLEKHCKGKGDYSRKIWTVLVFMLWHQIYVEKQNDEIVDIQAMMKKM